jgi:hypothetical protein
MEAKCKDFYLEFNCIAYLFVDVNIFAKFKQIRLKEAISIHVYDIVSHQIIK